ncbi:hypothetical protein SVAN01_01657 [Stagonosporopsis vannaccii]|nr:hypothetical protein SVAN01_01657 [Stagonosporopsis vannaccii]
MMPLDTLLALSPIFFFVIAAICFTLHGKTKSAYGENIKAITLVAPSIFPILYAAILGKMLRRVGLYQAERSATIGTVERLIGCQSVFTAIERQIALRRFDLLGVAILLAWLLSPIGGQTSLRMLSTQPSTEDFNNTARYFPLEGYAAQTFLFGFGRANLAWTLWAPLYMTALQTSRQYWKSPMDLFGAVRVPDIRQLSPSAIDAPNYDWHDFGSVNDIQYTSMLGLPIVGIPEFGNSSFNSQSFYWAVECSDWNQTDFEEVEHTQTSTFNMTLNRLEPSYERIGFIYQTKRLTQQNMSAFSEVPYSNNTGIHYTTNCTASPIVVESEIECQGQSCSVQRMRKLQRDLYSLFSPHEGPDNYLNLILQYMPGADIGYNGEPTTQSSELVEQWMIDPNLSQFEWTLRPSHSLWAFEDRWVNLAALPTDEFSRRLQIAMNTFWDASVGSTIRMGNFTLDQVEIMGTEGNFRWNTTELSGVRFAGEHYVVHKAFAGITMGLSLALCLTALVSLVLGVIIKAPDILGFVSTSARDNPYVQEHVPSRSDGLQASRVLRDVRMQIGDVNELGEVGHVAFTTMEEGAGKLSRKRMYD